MPGCCPPQSTLSSGNVHALYPQAFDSTGLKSLQANARIAGEQANAAASVRAISAWQTAAAEQRRRMEWQAIDLPHNSSHLFARLPFGDAVRLAVLAGTGQLSWTEINAALDAMIKLAIARKAGSPDRHQAREESRRSAEDEIWARYHAKCDAVFANDTVEGSTDPWSREQLRARERILNRLRSERDRALAALSRRTAPPSHVSRAGRPERSTAQLTAAERNALGKLNASGFAGSQLMADAISSLAAPLAGSMADSA